MNLKGTTLVKLMNNLSEAKGTTLVKLRYGFSEVEVQP